MALVACKECGREVSSSAAKCPHCGKKLRMGLLGKALITLGVIGVAFIGFGMMIPEHVAKANSVRRICEKHLIPSGQATQFQCDQEYSRIKNSGPK